MRNLARFLRVQHWGIQIPIVLVGALAYALVDRISSVEYARTCASVLFVQSLVLTGAYTLNDFFDRGADEAKGPDPRAFRYAVRKLGTALGTFVAGTVSAHLMFGTPAEVVVWVQVGGAVAYSAPGPRLKERGWLGVLAAAFLQRVPAFWMVALESSWNPLAAVVLTGWLGVVGTAFIVEHQVQDRAIDAVTGTSTLVTALSVGQTVRLRRAVHRALHVTPIVVLVVWVSVAPTWPSLAAGALIFLANLLLERVLSTHYASNERVAPLNGGVPA